MEISPESGKRDLYNESCYYSGERSNLVKEMPIQLLGDKDNQSA
jgi:hypothetical protein